MPRFVTIGNCVSACFGCFCLGVLAGVLVASVAIYWPLIRETLLP